MSDRLVLKGIDGIVDNHSGDDLTFVRPTSGRYHLFPRWWNRKGTVQYENACILKLHREGGDVRVIVPVNPDTLLEIRWDSDTEQFTFPVHRSVDRVAIVELDTNQLLQEYQFSRISGGKVLKRSLVPLPTKKKDSTDS